MFLIFSMVVSPARFVMVFLFAKHCSSNDIPYDVVFLFLVYYIACSW